MAGMGELSIIVNNAGCGKEQMPMGQDGVKALIDEFWTTEGEIAVDLYIIRHADALALGEHGITDDAERPLSAAGEAESQKIGNALKKRNIQLDRLVTSPLLRARQTAEFMLKTRSIDEGPQITVSEDLAPGGKPRKLARFLRKLGGEHVGLVGHMPHIADWSAWLIGSKKAQLDFAKAGIAHIVCGEAPRKGMGVLQWLVTPEWFE